MFYPVSEDLTINLKQVKMFRFNLDNWEVYFDRADESPIKISLEQYQEIMEMTSEEYEKEDSEDENKSIERPERKPMREIKISL